MSQLPHARERQPQPSQCSPTPVTRVSESGRRVRMANEAKGSILGLLRFIADWRWRRGVYDFVAI